MNVKGTVPKIVAKNGIYKIIQWRMIDNAIAHKSQIFAKIPTLNKEESLKIKLIKWLILIKKILHSKHSKS